MFIKFIIVSVKNSFIWKQHDIFHIKYDLSKKKVNARPFYIIYAISRTAHYRKIQVSELLLKMQVAHGILQFSAHGLKLTSLSQNTRWPPEYYEPSHAKHVYAIGTDQPAHPLSWISDFLNRFPVTTYTQRQWKVTTFEISIFWKLLKESGQLRYISYFRSTTDTREQ